jgi:hypothetical protein
VKRKVVVFIGYLLVTGCLVFCIAASAAPGELNFLTISGKVKDSSSGRGVAYAAVSVTGRQIGTVSNTEGEFTLKVPLVPDISEISVSHIGYKSSRFFIEDLTRGDTDLLIDPHVVMLGEVSVRPTDARAIVASALTRTSENYPVVPYRLTGFYRETIRQRRDYVSVSEAVVDIYQASYGSAHDRDMFRIVKGRKSGNIKRADTLLVKLQGGPHVSMLLDIVKNSDLLISEETIGLYTYELVDIVQVDQVSNYVIEFRPRMVVNYPLYYGKLYISADRHAITMAEFSLDLSDSDKAAQNFILRKPSRLRFNPVSTRYLVSYSEVDGRYQPNYMRYELEFFADWRRRIFRTGYTIVSEMAVTSRSTIGAEKIPQNEAFRPNAVLADQVPVYFDDDFWGEYNYIEPEQSVEAAIKRINRRLEW